MSSVARARSWLFERALPYWSERAEDRVHGGSLEELTLDGAPSNPGFKRVRVLCRQVYVWSHASLLGWASGRDLAEAHSRLLMRTCWQGPGLGWARLLRPDNSVLDPRPDLYDTAFAIFALAWAYRATGRDEMLALALQTIDFIEDRMRHPGGAGFLHALPGEGARLQNPHMHLLEACIAGFEASRHPRFEAIARHLVQLFKTRFFDLGRGTLAEYFDEGWNRAAGEAGRIVEPGHQYEWAWILAAAHRQFGIPVEAEIRALVAFAERTGVDPAGRVRNAVRDDGTVLDGCSRTWPNTERIKAAVAIGELLGEDMSAMLEGSLELLLDRYLHADGSWTDAFDAEGRPIAKAMPVSTLYHVFLAIAEAMRVSGNVAALRR